MLLLSPTGSGKTLAAFLWCINRLMFDPVPAPTRRCRVLYVSPLKALAVDVERNLRAPIAGITNVAVRLGTPHVVPAVSVRTGDTPASERTRFKREPADILITTPESLYLLLTSSSRRPSARSTPSSSTRSTRGAHQARRPPRALARTPGAPLRPAAAAGRPLRDATPARGGGQVPRRGGRHRAGRGGARSCEAHETKHADDDGRVMPGSLLGDEHGPVSFRPVTIVDAGAKKAIDVRIEVPVEDMARIGEPIDIPSGATSQGTARTTIWSAIHPRLLQLVRSHRSTLLFVNSRRIAERLASA